MLLEGALAVVVILACCAGVGMGKFDRTADGQYVSVTTETTGPYAEWRQHYKLGTRWSDFKLREKVGAFVEGGANFLSAIGIPLKAGIALIAVLVASFAATTLDTATRLQRYVIQELAGTHRHQAVDEQVCGDGAGGNSWWFVGHASRRGWETVRDRGLDPVAVVWCHESVAGGIGIHGDGVLLVATQQARLVCFHPHGPDVDPARLGIALADVSPHVRLVAIGRLSAVVDWNRGTLFADLDDHRGDPGSGRGRRACSRKPCRPYPKKPLASPP